VQAVTGVEGLSAGGTRITLAADAYAIELEADGGAMVRIVRRDTAERIVVRFTAGLAADWTELPDALRHGVLRLAAHHYRQRDADSARAMPPAAVAALWRPWRRLRVA
jgi:uncharacterized phiE125 gp8 family phage protein